ncbi:MAG: ABC transporter ATP-binding protein [Candidatus Thorarchaeota archaeon]|nr:MAG: ABC transporter ATP-binding protein [Candidatus Thorarchaeota archaeon]
MSSEYAVELEGITKIFSGGVQANKNITIKVRKGEVIGLLGENGAGKSTLMNILYGLLQPDEGRIVINGEEVDLRSPQDAIFRGVGMVHQHFQLVPVLTVTENVVLGLEPILKRMNITSIPAGSLLGSMLPIDFKTAAKRIREIGDENGLPVDPDAKIFDLSVGLQQRVEIIKMLYREAEILILDEPTAVLTPNEVDELFVTLKEFIKRGKTIILITHKLRETMALCDRICVLRDGELVGIVEKKDTSPQQLAEMMVGRPVFFTTEKEPKTPGAVVLSVEQLRVFDNRDIEKVKGVDLEVRSGEIFGIVGVQGNGQTELVEALTGLRKIKSGKILVTFQGLSLDVTGKNARFIRESGVSHIPEDRHKRGIILPFKITENIALGSHYKKPYAEGPLNSILALDVIRESTKEIVQDYSIRLSSVDALASTLSGGNQQKVVVARELSTKPVLVIASQPTRGLDVGATEYIHEVLIGLRDAGVAVLLVSAELDEIQNLADRIGVIYDGQIVAIKAPGAATPTELGLLMAGHSIDSALEEV